MKKMFLAVFIFFFIIIFPPPQAALANDDASKLPAITVINPLRGHQLGLENADLLESLKGQWEVTRNAGIDAAWLWQYSALEEREMIQFAKSTMKNQEFGIFLEIDRNLAEKSGTEYKGKGPWYFSDGLFLTSYDKFEREKQIDTVFAKFKETFGYYPKTVGAWWVGADSIEYMRKKYGVLAVLQCADQFDTDGYSLWGTPWSIPYIPSKNNAAIPAQNLQDAKDNVVILQWATRDPLKGYGPAVVNSTFSVQDYWLKQYDTSYYEFLSNVFLKKPYDQTVIGLEGGLPPESYRGIYQDQLKTAKKWDDDGKVTVELAGHFAEHFLEREEVLPSTNFFLTKDYKSDDQSFWYHSQHFRVGIEKIKDKIYLIDLRDYANSNSEDFNTLPNTEPLLRIETKSIIDSVRNPEEKVLLGTTDNLLSIKENTDSITLVAGSNHIAELSENKAAFFTKDYQKTFEFSNKNDNSYSVLIFVILLTSYMAFLSITSKNKRQTYAGLSLLLLHVLIMYPIISNVSFFSDAYLFDDRFINLLKFGSVLPVSPINKILIIFQIVPMLFIIFTNMAIIKSLKKFSLIFSAYSALFLITFLMYSSSFTWLVSLFQQGLKLKLFGILTLAILLVSILTFYKLYKLDKMKIFYPALCVLMCLVLFFNFNNIFDQKRIIITPFEMDALTAVYEEKKGVIYVKHSTISIVEKYRAIRPLLNRDYSSGQYLTGVRWQVIEQTEKQSLELKEHEGKLLFLPRYQGASMSSEDIEKYKLTKIFDNAQIAIFR